MIILNYVFLSFAPWKTLLLTCSCTFQFDIGKKVAEFVARLGIDFANTDHWKNLEEIKNIYSDDNSNVLPVPLVCGEFMFVSILCMCGVGRREGVDGFLLRNI